MRRILFVFLDGVGLGPAGADNPLSLHEGPGFKQLSGGSTWTSALPDDRTDQRHVGRLDATLSIDGLPQSGTGQASLFTGVNCAQIVGRHFGPFPHSSTYPELDHKNLFHDVQRLSSHPNPAAFANAFPPSFFDAADRRWSVTTRCCVGANVPIRDIEALRENRALTADLTRASWRQLLELDVSPCTEAEAAQTLLTLHREHQLTLYEYFLTDKVGHGRGPWKAETVLEALDRFFNSLLDSLLPAQESLVVTSDHGNMETTAHTQHTRNPVPLFVHGWAAPYFSEAETLTDVTPAIVEALEKEGQSV